MSALPMSQRVSEGSRETCVTKVSQGDLFADSGSNHRERWQRFLKEFSAEVDRISVKRLAGEVDEKASVISNAIAERDRHYVHAEWVVWVIANGPTNDLLRALADMRQHDIVPREVIPPEEELRRLKEAMAESLSAEVREVIARKVRR